MSKQNFEAIVDGQFPAQEWYGNELFISFPHLDADSEIAGYAMRLTEQYYATGREFREAEDVVRLVRDADTEFDAEVAKSAHVLADDRLRMFTDIYDNIVLDFEQIDEDTRIDSEFYDMYIDTICTEQLEHIEMNRQLPRATVESLQSLINELGIFYRLEYQKHFRQYI